MTSENEKDGLPVHPAARLSFFHRCALERIYWGRTDPAERRDEMYRNNWRCIGLCALALGLSIFVVAIFPVGAVLFLTAFLLVACGIGCIRRR